MTLPTIARPPKAQERLRVLVVDDSAAQRQLMRAVLKRMGHDVVTASNAAEALHLCMADTDDEIRMILSDWQMPDMDGPDFCRVFRELARESYAYFILITSETDRAMKARGLEAGADDFVTRPLDLTELRARINTGRRILEMQEALLHRNHEVHSTLQNLQAIQDGINRDLAEARELQRAFLPPRHKTYLGSELSLRLITSGQIGGDLVGHFPISRTEIGLYSIDVSGHGIASALLTGRLAALFSWRSRRNNIAFIDETGPPQSPDQVMIRLNDFMLQELTSDLYFTAVLAYVDCTTGRVVFSQAGHPHPLVRRADGRVDRIGSGGPPVGLIAEATFDVETVQLGPGDSFLAYSDGLTECADTWGDMLEEEGLMALLEKVTPETDKALDMLEADLNRHAGINGFEDDISMLLFRYEVPAEGAMAAR